MPFLTSRVGANLAGASKPRDMIRSFTHKPLCTFLKTTTIPTYYGLSIAISRYIAMQLPPSRLYDTHLHCHIALHDHIADIVFVAKPPFIMFFIHVTLDHCTSWYTARGIHIESYFILVSSCNTEL